MAISSFNVPSVCQQVLLWLHVVPLTLLNKQAFTTLEYQHLLELIKRNAQTEPGQRRVETLSPIDDVAQLRRELCPHSRNA